MVIQKILFPEVGKCTATKLYFRTKNEDDYTLGERHIGIKRGDSVEFSTYFNGLSIDKWKKYTKIKDVSISLNIKGKARITLLEYDKIRDNVYQKVDGDFVVESEEVKNYVFGYDNESRGMLTFKITALEDGVVFYGGEYLSDIPEESRRKVKIGLCICTFKRESYIENNLRILNNSILNNNGSILNDKFEVFISDNGQTLDYDRLGSEKVHIFKNKNLGGAGGFTRDLIEIMNNNSEYNITHALLMDDDVVIEPEAIEKTYTILSTIREEYLDAFIGGAMLRRDKQNIQVEAGAVWNGGYLKSLKADLNLDELEACLYNEIEEYREYNAWWYCCFPVDIVTEDNLPLPIFIRGDDLEYGLRNMKHLILMNGICLWHEPFEYKYSSFLNYYIVRNQFIDDSFHCEWFDKKHAKKLIWHTCLREILLYRYRNVDLFLRGATDFLKGPEYLMHLDGEALHKEIMASGYKAVDLDTLDVKFSYPMYERTIKTGESKKETAKRFLTLNGWIVPGKGDAIAPVELGWSKYAYRKKRVLYYDVSSKKGFVCEKSYKEAIRCLFNIFITNVKLSLFYRRTQKSYRVDGLKLRSYDFWKGYLGI